MFFSFWKTFINLGVFSHTQYIVHTVQMGCLKCSTDIFTLRSGAYFVTAIALRFLPPYKQFFPVHDVCISSKWVQPFILSWSSYILRTGLSEKATKYEEISTFIFDTKYISNFKWNLEISSNVSGFLRIYELYMLNRIIQNRNKIFGSFMAVLLPTFKSNSFNLGDCKKSRQNHFWIVCKKRMPYANLQFTQSYIFQVL